MPPPTGRVLVADRDPDLRALAQAVLMRAGYAVATADGGLDALAAAESGGMRVYVLEVDLPDLSGLAVCHKIKGCTRTASSPVLLISSTSAPEDIEAGYAAGGDDYLRKPFSSSELVHRVDALRAAAREHLDRPSGM